MGAWIVSRRSTNSQIRQQQVFDGNIPNASLYKSVCAYTPSSIAFFCIHVRDGISYDLPFAMPFHLIQRKVWPLCFVAHDFKMWQIEEITV